MFGILKCTICFPINPVSSDVNKHVISPRCCDINRKLGNEKKDCDMQIFFYLYLISNNWYSEIKVN